jgi:PIN like domain
VRFFFDNTMSKKVVEALKILDANNQIVHLTDHFPADTPDEAWISNLAQEGNWIVISGDVRISRNPGQRKAWHESNLVAFFLAKGWTNLPLWDQAWKFMKWWPEIVTLASRMRPPAEFLIPVSSSKMQQLQIR